MHNQANHRFTSPLKNRLKKGVLASCVAVCFFSGSANASLWDWLFGDRSGSSHSDHDGHEHDVPVRERNVGTHQDYQDWLKENPWHASYAKKYEDFLSAQLGAEVPPMHELLTTARSWQACNHQPYQVPPEELWSNMLPTLQLYNTLKWRGILPSETKIRSVYRNPDLNRCAGGAASSKHMTNGAIDIWVPSYGDDSWALYQMKDKLCQFWRDEGQRYQFGLGLYATGAIHLDTQGYRKWGAQFSSTGSPCRDVVETEEVLWIDGQF